MFLVEKLTQVRRSSLTDGHTSGLESLTYVLVVLRGGGGGLQAISMWPRLSETRMAEPIQPLQQQR
jgi:hypothetical protein